MPRQGQWATTGASALAMDGRSVHGESGTSLTRRDDEGSALRTFEEDRRGKMSAVNLKPVDDAAQPAEQAQSEAANDSAE